MPYTPFQTTGMADPRRLHVGNRVRFIDVPILAKFIPAGTTGTITAKIGYRAFEVQCDGYPIGVIDMPENIRKCSKQPTPYKPAMRFTSRRKSS